MGGDTSLKQTPTFHIAGRSHTGRMYIDLREAGKGSEPRGDFLAGGPPP